MIHFDSINNISYMLAHSELSHMPQLVMSFGVLFLVVLVITNLLELTKDLLATSRWSMIVTDSDNVIECLSAEDVSLQEYLDKQVQVFTSTKSGRWYARQKLQVQVSVQSPIVDNCVYSAELPTVVMDAGVMAVDLSQYAKEQVECVKYAFARFQVFKVIPALALALSYVLPVADWLDTVIEAPAKIASMQKEIVSLRQQLQEQKVATVRAETTKVEAMLNMDPTDAPDPRIQA